MGRSHDRKLIFVLCIFLLIGILINSRPVSQQVQKKIPLAIALRNIDKDWHQGPPVRLDKDVIQKLSLDDFIYQEYRKGDNEVTLYIGYYFTTEKLGSAHDPLVCFPGQGWKISKKEKGSISVDSSSNMSISYTTLLVEKGMEKQLILYWFQTYDKATANTFSQKINSLTQKITRVNEDNALVRINCQIENNNVSECKKKVLSFVQAFYPFFIDYIKDKKN